MEEIAWLVFQGISRVQGAVSDQLVALAAEAARYLELPVPMCGKIRELEKRCAEISNETKFMVACLTETKPEQNEEIYRTLPRTAEKENAIIGMDVVCYK